MKRELVAGALLVLLLATALGNLSYLCRLVDRVERHVELSAAALEDGRGELALKELDIALELWREAERYTHVFVRHSEIDTVSDEFYELRHTLYTESADSREAYLRLIYHLESIEEMEHLRIGSIF